MNRIEAAMKEFGKYEARMEKLFPGNMQANRAFQRERLAAMDKISASPGSTLSVEERMTLRILLYEKRALERKLFPNRTIRVLRRLFVPLAIALENTFKDLKDRRTVRIFEADLRGQGYLLEGRLAMENGKLVSRVQRIDLAAGQRFEYQLVNTLSNNGQGITEGIKATLIGKDGSVTRNFFKVENEKLPSHKDMISLLKGEEVVVEGPEGKYRAKLDFNDRDAKDSFNLKPALEQSVLQKNEGLKARGNDQTPRRSINRRKSLGL